VSAYIVLVYGILVAAGGVMGYVKSKSMPSLITGLLFGNLLIGCSVFMLNGDIRATYVALVLSLALLAIFFFRFRVSKKIYARRLDDYFKSGRFNYSHFGSFLKSDNDPDSSTSSGQALFFKG